MDAAITTALAQTTLVAGSWVSFAGIAYFVYYDAETGEVQCLNAGYNTVQAETDPMSMPGTPHPAGRHTLVPGFMAGLEVAHRRYGRLPWRALFEPSIYLAEEGFPVDNVMAGLIASRKDVLSRRDETRAIFCGDDGEFLKSGQHLAQPALAHTLRRVAEEGASYMYEGEWAEKMVAAVRDEGGLMTVDDLRAYETAWEPAISTAYREYDVWTVPPPEAGCVQLLEALNLIEDAEIGDMPHWTEDADTLYRFIQACRIGLLITYSEKYPAAAGPDSEDPYSPWRRITKEHSAELLDLLERNDWERSWETQLSTRLFSDLGPPGSHSDGVVVVDGDGNACALVHSINAITWGTTGIFVDGVSIPDSASFQREMIARAGPGSRLPNVTNPCIVTQDGLPVLAASVIGSALHQCMLQNLVNILDHGMDPQESVDMPKFWGRPLDGDSMQNNIDGTFPESLLEAVRERGQGLHVLNRPARSAGISHFVGIRIDPIEETLTGGGTALFNGVFEGD